MTSAVYDVEYMGSVAVTRSTATLRLGMLQRSLLDLYMTYIPATSAKLPSVTAARQLPQRRLTLTDRGIIVSAIDAVPSGRAENDAFYAMPSIIFWEAVRSVCDLPVILLRPTFTDLPSFIQGVSIACYAEPCISYGRVVRPSVRPSVRLSHAGIVSKRRKLRSRVFTDG